MAILVHGGMVTRANNAQLAELLSERFTVISYDRSGRGDSGDQPGSLAAMLIATAVASAADDDAGQRGDQQG